MFILANILSIIHNVKKTKNLLFICILICMFEIFLLYLCLYSNQLKQPKMKVIKIETIDNIKIATIELTSTTHQDVANEIKTNSDVDNCDIVIF